MRQKVLVVEDDPAALAGMVEIFIMAGYETRGAGTFAEGRRLLADVAPDLLVVDVRLGAFNGLHLLYCGHFDCPQMAAIVTTGFPDAVLEAEAKRHGATFVLKPVNPESLLTLAREALRARTRPDRRRWPRTRLARELRADIDRASVTVVEISYGGLRFSVPDPSLVPGGPFPIRLPILEPPVLAACAWTRQDRVWGLVWCGADIPQEQGAVMEAWHRAVDSLGDTGVA